MRRRWRCSDGDLFVRKATVEYHGSARYDDVLDIGIRCARVGNSSMLFECAAFRQDRLLVSRRTGLRLRRPAQPDRRGRCPRPLREVLQGFEAGRRWSTVRVGNWDELGREAQQIRTEVFVDEQNIPAEMEWDDADAAASTRSRSTASACRWRPAGCSSMCPGSRRSAAWRCGRRCAAAASAARCSMRLLQVAREHGDREAVLHAQTSASGFYARAGFAERGPIFDEGGIPHVEMVRAL